MRDEWGIVRGIVFVLLVLPATAWAQMQGIPQSPIAPTVMTGDRVPEGVYLMPWIATGVLYDDNILFSRNGQHQDDAFVRVTPGLQASYQSTPFTIVGNYRFDSEVYNKHSELDSATQRQFGTIDLRIRPSSSLTIANAAGYAETHTPFELNLLTSAQAARFKTERFFENPSAEYRIDSLTRATGSYGYSKDIFFFNPTGNLEINTHIFQLQLDRRIGAHDTLGPAYIGRLFTFGGPFASQVGGNTESTTSNAIMVAWGHEFSTDTRLDVRVGPRVTKGSLDNHPEAYVSLRHRIQGGEVGLAYYSAVTTLIGTAGSIQSDSVILSGSYEPVKHLTMTLAGTGAWITSSSFNSKVYTGYLEAAYQFNKYVTGKGSAFFSYQEGNFIPTGGVSSSDIFISRNVFWLRLEFTFPTRWES